MPRAIPTVLRCTSTTSRACKCPEFETKTTGFVTTREPGLSWFCNLNELRTKWPQPLIRLQDAPGRLFPVKLAAPSTRVCHKIILWLPVAATCAFERRAAGQTEQCQGQRNPRWMPGGRAIGSAGRVPAPDSMDSGTTVSHPHRFRGGAAEAGISRAGRGLSLERRAGAEALGSARPMLGGSACLTDLCKMRELSHGCCRSP